MSTTWGSKQCWRLGMPRRSISLRKAITWFRSSSGHTRVTLHSQTVGKNPFFRIASNLLRHCLQMKNSLSNLWSNSSPAPSQSPDSCDGEPTFVFSHSLESSSHIREISARNYEMQKIVQNPQIQMKPKTRRTDQRRERGYKNLVEPSAQDGDATGSLPITLPEIKKTRSAHIMVTPQRLVSRLTFAGHKRVQERGHISPHV